MGLSLRRGLPLLRVDVDLDDRRGAAGPVVRPAAAGLLPHLHRRDGRRDQPRAVRHAGVRGRPRRRLQHRVLAPSSSRCSCSPSTSTWSPSRPSPITLFLGGWRAPWPITTFWEGANHGWWPMLWFVVKVAAAAVLLHLAARHAAPRALRPVHEAGLEGPHPGLAGLADAGRHRPGAAQRGLRLPARSCSTSAAAVARAAADLLRRGRLPATREAKAEADGRGRPSRLRPDGGRLPRTAAARPDPAARAAPPAAPGAGADCQWRAGH